MCVGGRGGRGVGGHSAGVLLLRTRGAAASCPTSITHKKGGKKGNNTEKEDGGGEEKEGSGVRVEGVKGGRRKQVG